MSRPIGCLIIHVHSSPGGASVAVLERHSGFVHVARKPTKVPLLLLLHASNASGVSMRHLLGALALALILDLLKFEVRHERRLAALGARPGAKGRGQQPLSNAFGVKHVPAWKLGDLDTDLVILQAEGALGFHFIALDSDRAEEAAIKNGSSAPRLSGRIAPGVENPLPSPRRALFLAPSPRSSVELEGAMARSGSRPSSPPDDIAMGA